MPNVGENVESLESLYVAGGNPNLKTVSQYLLKFNLNLPFHLAVQHFDICQREMKTCVHMTFM